MVLLNVLLYSISRNAKELCLDLWREGQDICSVITRIFITEMSTTNKLYCNIFVVIFGVINICITFLQTDGIPIPFTVLIFALEPLLVVVGKNVVEDVERMAKIVSVTSFWLIVIGEVKKSGAWFVAGNGLFG